MSELSQNSEFFWGDKWSIENNLAWFVAGEINILFCMDMATNFCKAIAALPDYLQSGFRTNSNCIKCGDVIFCMPDYGKYIWCYNLSTCEFQKIEIINPDQIRLMIGDFWKCGSVLWAVSIGLKQVLEIDMERKKVIGYYCITKQVSERIAKSIKSENYIYITSLLKGRIYEFSIETKEIHVIEIPMIKDGLRTISVYNNKFCLSGYKRQLYIWEKNMDQIKILTHFPKDFGIYNFSGKQTKFLDCDKTVYNTFVFLESILVGKYVWYIPFQTNQILYINADMDDINVFEIKKENETIGSIKNRQMNCKYILQYVYKDRYIGLYSLKNKIVFEIDTKTLNVKERFITMDFSNVENIFTDWIFRESIIQETLLYKKMIRQNKNGRMRKEEIGKQIYNCI